MSKHNEYLIEDLSYSNIDVKKLGIYGNCIFNKNEIIRKMRGSVKEFLNSNKEVDYLLIYYYPTHEDMNSNTALCYLKLDEDINKKSLTDEKICQKLLWNESYDFLTDSKIAKRLVYYNILNEANKMLQVVEEACFILYELQMIVNYRSLSEYDGFREYLERWLIRAGHTNKLYWKLKYIVNYDFTLLIRHMNNILYYFYIPDHREDAKGENRKQQIFNNEIANARDNFEVIHKELTNFIEKSSMKEGHKDNGSYFSKNFEKRKYESMNELKEMIKLGEVIAFLEKFSDFKID